MGAVWLLALTQTIVMPLIAAGVIAAVASPVVAWLQRLGVLGGVVLVWGADIGAVWQGLHAG